MLEDWPDDNNPDTDIDNNEPEVSNEIESNNANNFDYIFEKEISGGPNLFAVFSGLRMFDCALVCTHKGK